MTITQRAYDKIGDLIEQEEARIKEELSDKPEWVAQEIVNELCDAYDLLYDALHKVGIFDIDEEDEEEDD
tara:strand:- start:1949 stop:2158 length:210 start_codon:yes stop_codon:yes gene_type:complete